MISQMWASNWAECSRVFAVTPSGKSLPSKPFPLLAASNPAHVLRDPNTRRITAKMLNGDYACLPKPRSEEARPKAVVGGNRRHCFHLLGDCSRNGAVRDRSSSTHSSGSGYRDFVESL